jgi:hypothetical protein
MIDVSLDRQRVAAELAEFVMQPPGVAGVGEPGDPLGSGGEQDPVPGPAGADAQKMHVQLENKNAIVYGAAGSMGMR